MDQEQATLCLLTAVQTALMAGAAIMEIYSGSDYALDYKQDKSPLTEADQKAHALIAKELQKTGIPVLSEEGREIPYSERQQWDLLWIVDPLDGTKEFIKKNGEFTVNIALVQRQRPILGVVFAPDMNQLYFGGPALGAHARRIEAEAPPGSLQELIQDSERLPRPQERSAYVIMGSRSHPSKELDAFVQAKQKTHPKVEFISAGSSLKICRVAEGTADIYPRLGPTMEWDTAAGHAIALGAGKEVTIWEEGSPLLYNREELMNPWFVVS